MLIQWQPMPPQTYLALVLLRSTHRLRPLPPEPHSHRLQKLHRATHPRRNHRPANRNKTHLPVERRFYLAGTYICQQAILGGRIDIYPEYTGTALTAVLKEKPNADPAAVYDQVKTEYAKRFNLAVGPPFGFNDTFAMEIRGEDARRLGLKTISQAAPYTPQWRAGFGYEFMERPDGYKGLAATYGLRFADSPRIMDLGLLTRALKDKQVDLIAGNTTDGLIPALDLFVLEDDKHYFPPYEAVPIIRQETLARHPEVSPSPGRTRRTKFPTTTCANSTMPSTASTAT